jgi:hypothetical protein
VPGVSRAARGVSGLAMGLIALTGIGFVATPGVDADGGYPVAISIQNASAKVGEKAVIIAKISFADGFKITDSYGHRLSGLSAPDGVELERRVVRGSVQDGSIVFAVGVTPRRAGTHVVSGLFRFSYHNGQELDIRSARFEAIVTGTE